MGRLAWYTLTQLKYIKNKKGKIGYQSNRKGRMNWSFVCRSTLDISQNYYPTITKKKKGIFFTRQNGLLEKFQTKILLKGYLKSQEGGRMNYLRNGHPLKALQQRCSFCRTQTDQTSLLFPSHFRHIARIRGRLQWGLIFACHTRELMEYALHVTAFTLYGRKKEPHSDTYSCTDKRQHNSFI